MEYIKLFENHSQYESYAGGGMLKPNVSHCIQENEVHYNPHTFADEYFTTVARENGAISFNIWKSMGTDMITSISYSTDDGETWTTTNNTDNKSEHLAITVNVNEGDKVMWKGNATQLGFQDGVDGPVFGSFFSSDCEFDAQGNVMSLLYEDNFKGQTDLTGKDCAFANLFSDFDGENICNVVNTKNLSLPATTLAQYCYYGMFVVCTGLTTAPELPAETLADYCYGGMFFGCTSLTTAPELPATTLASSCYQEMFNGCTSLTAAPKLPATTLATYCYVNMFSGCTSLTTAPELPATTLADECYGGMFWDCTSLTTAPQLPATTLAESCYANMFAGCTNLTTAPNLPATTLAERCYIWMFASCTSLTTAPELPATTLTSGCYNYMFNRCTSLNYIKAMFTTTPSLDYTRNWVSEVASTGTFVKNAAATWTTTGIDGIPTGWTVQTAS